jgi:exodeoxyribonuclease VII small subunit
MTDKSRTKKNSGESGENSLSDSPTFEAALESLEATIDELEQPGLTLDKSLELFEKGISLIRACDSHLKKAQGKVAELLKGENGEFAEKVLGITLESFIGKDQSDE